MYTVIGTSGTRTFRVLWLLEEMGLGFTHIPAAPRSAEVVAQNVSGKVPVLLDGDTPITDSTAILTYLTDKHGVFTNTPASLLRARQDSLTHVLLDEFDATLWAAARHSFILPEHLRLPALKATLKWEFERSQRLLVRRMPDAPFLMGDAMTVPDFIATHCCSWAQRAGFDIIEPRFAEYLARMQARPAFQRAAAR